MSNDLYYLTRLKRSEHSVGADVVIITEMQALYRNRVTFSTQPPVPYIKLFCDLCCLLERESSWKKTCSFLEIYLLVYSLIRKLTRLWFCLYHFRQLQCLGLSINMILEKLESLKKPVYHVTRMYSLWNRRFLFVSANTAFDFRYFVISSSPLHEQAVFSF